MKRNIPKMFISNLLVIFISIIMSIISFLIVYVTNIKDSKNAVVNNIYLIGKEQRNTITTLISEVEYEIKLYGTMESFKKMDKDKVIKHMAFIKANRERYANILVLDKEKKVVYGYIDKVSEFLQEPFLDKAYAMEDIVAKTVKINDSFYVDIYYSIRSENGEVVGLLFFRVSINEINLITKNIKIDESTESYLVNSNGVMMTESRFVPDAVGNVRLDIKKLKLNIDYSKTNPYKDYRNKMVYGRYFPIGLDNWTLVVEADADFNKVKESKLKLIGQVAIGGQALILLLIQQYLKNKFNIFIPLDKINPMIEDGREGENN